MRVESFAADILARNPADDTIVLIENQLEKTDHTHLGQIMTYLAGLEAHTVVWIAPEFRKAHLSTIRWLNEHTADGFSFFAVRLRVVRIADSPFAPIFEVVAQPDDWQRVVSEKKRSVEADLYDLRHEFWSAFAERHPRLKDKGLAPTKVSNTWLKLHDDPEINLSVFAGVQRSGAFIRGARGASNEAFSEMISPFEEGIRARLPDATWIDSSRGFAVWSELPQNITRREDWPLIMDWMAQAYDDYQRAVSAALAGEQNA